MENTISPYDFGKNLVEHAQRVSINDLLRNIKKDLKLKLLEAQIGILGVEVELITSKSGFGGVRFWFACPICSKKKGVIFAYADFIGCRQCLKLKYKAQRFKGMLEDKI